MRSVPMVAGLAALVLAGWLASPSAQPDPLCTADPQLRVKVGSQLFAVPRVYLPHIFDYKGNLVGLPKSICQRPQDPPIEAAQFFIRGSDPYMKQDARTSAISGVQVELFSRRALPDRLWAEQTFVQCSDPSLRSASGVDYGLSCHSGRFTFSDDVLLNYKFHSAQYPQSQWENLDRDVRNFVNSLTLPENMR